MKKLFIVLFALMAGMTWAQQSPVTAGSDGKSWTLATRSFIYQIRVSDQGKVNMFYFGDKSQNPDMLRNPLGEEITVRGGYSATTPMLEAVFKEEQPRIAGVFLRRLQIYMPIQSDTTIQYILGGEQKAEITIADTRIENPYNTYVNSGLPPGPVGSPGMDAIKAVLNPENTDYLYFVAEKDGHHRFTRTYEEHLQAIEDIHGPQ